MVLARSRKAEHGPGRFGDIAFQSNEPHSSKAGLVLHCDLKRDH